VGFAGERKIVDRTKLLLAGILVIAAAGAFVYFDPMDLDLLGLKKSSVVAKAETPPRAPAPKAQPPAPAPKAAVAPAKTNASVAVSPTTPTPAATSPVAAPKTAVATMQATMLAVSASPVAVATQVPPPALKPAPARITSKPAIDKPMRPKDQDLRHCLELETDAAIAKCAGE